MTSAEVGPLCNGPSGSPAPEAGRATPTDGERSCRAPVRFPRFSALHEEWRAREGGPQRFGQLKARLQGVSPKVLSQTLKRLEEQDLLTRTVYAEVPARVEYELTGLGRSAAVPMKHLRDWVEANAAAG